MGYIMKLIIPSIVAYVAIRSPVLRFLAAFIAMYVLGVFDNKHHSS